MKSLSVWVVLAGVAFGQMPKDLPARNSYKGGQPAMNEIPRREPLPHRV